MSTSEDSDHMAPPSAAPASLAERASAEVRRQLETKLASGLYLAATPIGNLGDISLRALATLARADVIYCEDTRHSRTLLAHYAIDRPLKPYHEHNAEAERPRVLAQIESGKSVALISDAGTPLISDPGYKLVRAALDGGHRVSALPGASALLAGLSMAGLPTDAFHFAGFLPPKENARRTRLADLASIPSTLVLFEAPNRLVATLEAIALVLGDREVAVARELTKRFEELRRGSAQSLAAELHGQEIKGEIVLIIGPPTAPVAASDEQIARELTRALEQMSFKDAVRTVSDMLRESRSRVYDLGLKLKEARNAP